MKYFIIAGEASGDLHGSHLIKEIKLLKPNSEIQAWGGDLMQEQGAEIKKHIKQLAFMGFVEVLQNIRTIQKNFKLCKKQIKKFNPHTVIFIDYPGFNLRMAKWVKKQGYKSVYFISPNVWAWKASRVYKIRDYIDQMIVILPFEKDFYKKYGVEVKYFGHPLMDAIKNHRKTSFEEFCNENNLNQKPKIALLPGSRKQEIKHILPIISEIVDDFPDYEFVIAGTSTIPIELYKQNLKTENIKIIFGKTYDILSHSTAGLIKSGTSTLEAALFDLPQVVCYKGGKISVAIAKLVANVKYISLVNLILDKASVKELIQNDLNKQNLIIELQNILPKGERNTAIKKDYAKLFELLDSKDIYKNIARVL
ncbi:MAG: lipid-A-disaccharide synthase [Bacteroidales bacterium]|nr:lipid-A-disaccharide synthase [Bacteroidales bacterium]